MLQGLWLGLQSGQTLTYRLTRQGPGGCTGCADKIALTQYAHRLICRSKKTRTAVQSSYINICLFCRHVQVDAAHALTKITHKAVHANIEKLNSAQFDRTDDSLASFFLVSVCCMQMDEGLGFRV